VKKSKKWTRVERFERLWLVLRQLLREKIFISPENGKNLLLSRENKKKQGLWEKEEENFFTLFYHFSFTQRN